MNLEVGKKYRRRDGGIVEITGKKRRFGAPSMFTSKIYSEAFGTELLSAPYYNYLKNGRRITNHKTPEDLIEEIPSL